MRNALLFFLFLLSLCTSPLYPSKTELSVVSSNPLSATLLLIANRSHLPPLLEMRLSAGEDLDSITVRYRLSNYSDFNYLSLGGLKAGQSLTFNLTPIVDSGILYLSEDTVLPLEVKISYCSVECNRSIEQTVPVTVKGRNAFSWEKLDYLAAWISYKSPEVRRFSTNATAGLSTSSEENKVIAAELIYNKLKEKGIRYASDPRDNLGVYDYVQFPIETLDLKAGDCDDLVVLYSALLESVGVPTVIYSLPGHLIVALNLSNGYLPVEITMLDAYNFTEAVDSGLELLRSTAIIGKTSLASCESAGINPVVTPSNVGVQYSFSQSCSDVEILSRTISRCAWSLDMGCFCYADVSLRNTGSSTANVCLDIYGKKEGGTALTGKKRKCLDVQDIATASVVIDTACFSRYSLEADFISKQGCSCEIRLLFSNPGVNVEKCYLLNSTVGSKQECLTIQQGQSSKTVQLSNTPCGKPIDLSLIEVVS